MFILKLYLDFSFDFTTEEQIKELKEDLEKIEEMY